MIERLRIRIPAGAVGEFSSPELTSCADSYSVSVPPPVSPQWHVKDPDHSANGRLPLPHSQASALFIGSDSSAHDTIQMALWNGLAPRSVGPGRRGPVSVQPTLALAQFLLLQ